MKLSLNWIKDYVALPDDMDLKQLAFDLTMSTVEVEGAHELARDFDGIVVGEIKEVLPHPNADKLRICKVDIADVVLVKCYLINSKKYSISKQGMINADVQGKSNGLNAQDALAIMKYSLKLIKSLPV